MNRVYIVGNITGDIYFDRLLIKNEKRSFLRLLLMAERPRNVYGMRIVLWDQKAELYFPYLKKGSELAVIGQLESRMHQGKIFHEVVSENLLLLRKIDWERGETARKQYGLPNPHGDANDVFILGDVLEDIRFDWFKPKSDNGSRDMAFLRLLLKSDEYLDGFRVVAYGSLAEVARPYLQPGSKIAVDGKIQTPADRETGKKVVEVVVRNMTFLQNINWAAGDAARLQIEVSGVRLDEIEAISHGD